MTAKSLVVTYSQIDYDSSVDLCDECAALSETPEVRAVVGRLGEVCRGAHEGVCECCGEGEVRS